MADEIGFLMESTTKADLDKHITQLKAADFKKKTATPTTRTCLMSESNSTPKPPRRYPLARSADWRGQRHCSKPFLSKKSTLTGLIEPSEEMPEYLQLYYINLTRQDIVAWLQELQKAGFTVEGLGAAKANMTLKGKTYPPLSIQIENNGETEWMIDFKYSD